MLIFSLEFPTSGLGFPQLSQGSLSQHPTRRVGIWALHIFVEARAWRWISTTRTDLCLRHTPKPRVPRIHWLRACVSMPFFFLPDYMVTYYVGYNPTPNQARHRSPFGFCS